MKNTYIITLVLFMSSFWLHAGEQQKLTKAPDGMITVIRDNGSWRFKILTSDSGWNTSSSINKATLNGEGYMLPISLSGDPSGIDINRSYTSIVLSDQMVKTASLELHWSSMGRRGNKAIIYTLSLSELTK